MRPHLSRTSEGEHPISPPPTLLRLPPEIFSYILDRLPFVDVCSLREASKAHAEHEDICRRIFASVRLSALKSDLEAFKNLPTRKLSRFVQHIYWIPYPTSVKGLVNWVHWGSCRECKGTYYNSSRFPGYSNGQFKCGRGIGPSADAAVLLLHLFWTISDSTDRSVFIRSMSTLHTYLASVMAEFPHIRSLIIEKNPIWRSVGVDVFDRFNGRTIGTIHDIKGIALAVEHGLRPVIQKAVHVNKLIMPLDHLTFEDGKSCRLGIQLVDSGNCVVEHYTLLSIYGAIPRALLDTVIEIRVYFRVSRHVPVVRVALGIQTLQSLEIYRTGQQNGGFSATELLALMRATGKPLPQLSSLYLTIIYASPSDLASIAGLFADSLRSLTISGTDFTTSHLIHLKDCKRLKIEKLEAHPRARVSAVELSPIAIARWLRNGNEHDLLDMQSPFSTPKLDGTEDQIIGIGSGNDFMPMVELIGGNL